jgi:hypothetical protein
MGEILGFQDFGISGLELRIRGWNQNPPNPEILKS